MFILTRIEKRCQQPSFDHIFADHLTGCSATSACTVASPSESTSLVSKLVCLGATTAALYAELEALTELEQSAWKLPTDEARRALEQRTHWRRPDVCCLRDTSL